jgi:hypothetical protein
MPVLLLDHLEEASVKIELEEQFYQLSQHVPMPPTMVSQTEIIHTLGLQDQQTDTV